MSTQTDFVPREYAQQIRDQLYAALQALAALTYAETDSWAAEIKAELAEPENRARLEAILQKHGYDKNSHSGYCLSPLETVLPDSFATANATAALCSVLAQVRKGTSGLPEKPRAFEAALPGAVKARLAEMQRPAESPEHQKLLAYMQARNEAAVDALLDKSRGGSGVSLYLEAKLDSYAGRTE